MKSTSVLGGLTGVLVGFAAALIFCWFTWVRPLQAHLDAREHSLQEWERLHRTERETIGTIKTVSTAELRKWVATVDEQNQRFATLERLAHEQELQLVGPSLDLVVIAAVVVLGVVGLVIFLFRDANAAAATTLDNIAELAPAQMLRVACAPRPSPAPGAASLSLTAPQPTSHRVTGPLAFEPPRTTGVVCHYDRRNASGWVRLPDASELFFHRDAVAPEDRQGLRCGSRVSFCRGQDERGRFIALEVRVIGRG